MLVTSIFPQYFQWSCPPGSLKVRIMWLRVELLTLSQMTNFRLFQTERVCRHNFKLNENGRKFFQWVENTVGKGEIAHYEQFLLFPQCFQKACTADT